MKIQLLFFAELREIFGAARFLDVPEGTSIGDIAGQLTGSSEKFASKSWPLLYAVNENFETAEKQLRDGDQLALMMPMSGG